MKYIKELDSIRGLGILLVVLYHWIPVDSIYNTFPNRPFGVDVFFVLSGFLITNILLVSRLESENRGISKKHAFLRFFVGRALRIFPIYFLVVLCIVLLHEFLGASLGNELVPALTYTLNFHFYYQQYWGDLTTHLWTLSIEEQFYLLWPLIILLMPQRYLPWVILAFTGTGVVSQLMITDQEFGYLPTYTCFDAFGLGAFMSWINIFRPQYLGQMYRVLQVLGVLSLVVLFVGAAFPDLIFLSPQRTLRSLVAAWAIAFVICRHHKNQQHALPFFSSNILQFLGKISYGMYLYHLFLPWLYHIINAPLNDLIPVQWGAIVLPLTVIENLILLILISWLSYQYIERPIMGLKNMKWVTRRFNSARSPAAGW